jgi:cytochrome c peroxidase
MFPERRAHEDRDRGISIAGRPAPRVPGAAALMARVARYAGLVAALVVAAFGLLLLASQPPLFGAAQDGLDAQLRGRLAQLGFTGRVGSTLATRLGRPVDPRLANIGRLLWFDTVTGLHGDNSCAGCHSPTNGFGDSQPIAIGIDNNGSVGPDRAGPRNMRRAPMVLNTAFFPALMWNGRFSSVSGDPFDNSTGFSFPAPEGASLSYEPHLLVAQAFIPPTERTEVAGFAFPGDDDAIRTEVARRVNAVPGYRQLFGEVFPTVRDGAPVDFEMFARAIAEFEFSLTFADAPIDRYARGANGALDNAEKHGAMLFFGQGGCGQCHAVSGTSHEMFTDFQEHAIAVPQLVPTATNNAFDGAGANQDFGREDATGDPADRYRFRTPSLRNVAVEAAYMHDGAFTTLAAAIRHHLDAVASLRRYDPTTQGLPQDLSGPVGPKAPLLAALDPRLATPIELTASEFADLLEFVRDALLDPRATPEHLRKLVPREVPSGRAVLSFEFDRRSRRASLANP